MAFSFIHELDCSGIQRPNFFFFSFIKKVQASQGTCLKIGADKVSLACVGVGFTNLSKRAT